jgi:hypothetical protein
VTPGEYRLDAFYSDASDSGPTSWSGGTDVVMGQVDITDIALTMAATGTVRGELVGEGDAARVDMEGMRITMSNASNSGNRALKYLAVATHSGQFSIPGVYPGEYHIAVDVADDRVSDIVMRSVLIRGKDADRMSVGPGMTVTATVILSRQDAELTGRVVSRNGGTQCIVVLTRADRTVWLVQRGDIKTVRTDSSGDYYIRDIVPGRYVLGVIPLTQGSMDDTVTLDDAQVTGTPVVIHSGMQTVSDLKGDRCSSVSRR